MTNEEFKARFLPLSDALYRIAYRYLEDESAASDAVQEVYMKLWSSRNNLDSVTNPKAYCYTLVKNHCIDTIRKSRRISGEDALPDRAMDELPDRQLTTKEALERTLKCIDLLPEKQREIIRLRIFEELEYPQIAVRLGISELNARVQLSLARKTLRTKLSGQTI